MFKVQLNQPDCSTEQKEWVVLCLVGEVAVGCCPVYLSYLKAMTLPGVKFWKVISCTNSDLPLDVTPAFFTTVLSSSYTRTQMLLDGLVALCHHKICTRNTHGNVFFDLHSVLWHAIDKAVILLVGSSVSSNCPCLQHHFLYLPWGRQEEDTQDTFSLTPDATRTIDMKQEQCILKTIVKLLKLHGI